MGEWGSQKTNIESGDCLKGGAWIVRRFKERLGKEEGGGVSLKINSNRKKSLLDGTRKPIKLKRVDKVFTEIFQDLIDCFLNIYSKEQLRPYIMSSK